MPPALRLCVQLKRKGCTLAKLFIGGLLGILIGALGTTLFLVSRVNALAKVDFSIVTPSVSSEVLLAVRQAESDFYAQQPALRRLIENGQDVAAFLAPSLVYRFDFSVGPFRLKGHTLDEVIPWALQNGYLELQSSPLADFHWLYVYLAEQPGLADWGAAVLLERLRQKHPQLSMLSWQEISADPNLIAKVYSCYMVAGGVWEAWKYDLIPGCVAAARMKLDQPWNMTSD